MISDGGEPIQRHVVALRPHLPLPGRILEVALVVESHPPEHGVEAATAQYLRHRGELEGCGALHRLRPHLDCGIGGEAEIAWAQAPRLKSGEKPGRLRPGADLRATAEDRSFAQIACNRPKLVHVEAIAADQLQVNALLARGAQNPTRIRAVAADIEDIDPGLLQSPQQACVVVRIGRVQVVDRLRLATRAQLFARLQRQTFAVGTTVMQDRDLRSAPPVGEEIPRQPALPIVPPVEPEHVLATLFGETQMGRGRRDHQDVRGLVDAGREQRRMRAEVPHDETDVRLDQLTCRFH